jgi:hypothetical protein
MRKIIVVAAASVLLAGCSMTARERNTVVGAAVGAGAGAVIGAASTGTPQGGWAGAAIGGATGGLVGYLLTPTYVAEPCYVRTRRGKWRRTSC